MPHTSPTRPSPTHRDTHGDIPEWEDAPLAQEIFLLNNLMQRVADRLVAHRGLTATRWLLLAALEHFDEPPSISELAADGLMTVQNVSRLVASMESDGLVERFNVKGSGRTTFIRATPLGERVRENACAEGERFSEHFLRGLAPADVDAAKSLLHRLIRNTQTLERELTTESAPQHTQRNGTASP